MTGTIERHPSRRVALLAVLAVLFQAILFGWHHHELSLPSGDAPALAFPAGGAPPEPADLDDDCDICQALHHLSAAPGEVVALAVPDAAASALLLPASIFIERAGERAFQARAPPRA